MKIFVWTYPTRMVHWVLVVLVASAFLTADDDNLIVWHALAGFHIAFVWLFRIIWGFWGPLYSRFSDFRFGPGPISSNRDAKASGSISYPGHQMEASWVMVLIYVVLMVVFISGFFALPSNQVPFPELVASENLAETAAVVHSAAVSVLWVLILVHITGVVLSFFNDRQAGVLQSMFTGFKNLEGEDARLSAFQNRLANAWLVLFVALVCGAVLLLV